MQKPTKKKLVLSRTTVRTLVSDDMARVAGGISRTDCHSIQRACNGGSDACISDDCPSGLGIATCTCTK